MSIQRRDFLKQVVVTGALLNFSNPDTFAKDSSGLPKCKICTLTGGPKHHLFGYYGICPWNRSGKYLLSWESPFQDHFPTQDEPAAIGLVDAQSGTFEKISETHAWNLQQGAMLHWNPLNDNEFLYNIETKQGKILVTLDMKQRRNISGQLRCDFHPRWNRTGDAICSDGIDQKTAARQLHIAYLDFT